ncbi:hypothetical protein BM613_05310 [Sulfoacidibacillus thermotolerans]|uniref:tetrahydrofolate synthase n=1 Tax=Sulfoacidibacillus thermotolerans TaxID=1765684 RepID=A0A2U3D9Y9_SULT2|nr:hypothetical protein BM613_05310 [Sulfoacidibacillus thermotolerans]
MFTRFYDAVSFVFSSYTRSKPYRSQGLDRDTRNPAHTRRLLDALGSPDRHQRNIKVTGSKGKGSTSRMIAQVLEQHGYRVGLFTSPHLIDFTERIRVNGQAISEKDFMRLLAQVQVPLVELEKRMAPHEYFGPVGVTAAVAMLYFAQEQTDVNVIELGRGARYDDVNAVQGEFAVITPVLFEHPEQLGPHLSDIAYNKAGIVTAELTGVVVGRQQSVAAQILREESRNQGVLMQSLDDDFFVRDIRAMEMGTHFTVQTRRREYSALHMRVLGRHQADNAAVAMATAEWFVGGALDPEKVRQALQEVQIPGRCQVLSGPPRIFIDGAINRESAQYVRELLELMQYARLHLIVAVPKDKDYRGLLEVLAPLCQELWLPQLKNPHLSFPQDANAFAAQFARVHEAATVDDAIAQAMATVGDDGLVAIVGTQSLVAEALAYFAIDTRNR